MRTVLRSSILSSSLAFALVASSAHAITDPAQSPQQPPPQQTNPDGSAVVMSQPGQQPGQPVMMQQPPPQRMGVWAQARLGGGVEWHGTHVDGSGTVQTGPRGNAFAMIAGGYQLPNRIGFSVYGGGRYLFSRICDGNRRCTGDPGTGVLDIEIGLLIRYTALEQSRLHPVAEIGGQIHIMPAPQAFGFGYGGQLSAGIEFDVTSNFSIDAMLRGQLFLSGWGTTVRGSAYDVDGLFGFRIEPMLGATLYW